MYPEKPQLMHQGISHLLVFLAEEPFVVWIHFALLWCEAFEVPVAPEHLGQAL